MMSQTGSCMSFGRLNIHCRSSKQKLNTPSSIESEIVDLSEHYLQSIYLVMFVEELRYYVRYNVLYQDNQSTIEVGK